jgi:hypothetical protein
MCFGQSSVKSLCIPDSVELLGKFCFWSSGLEQLTIGNKSRLRTIEKHCFEACHLKSVHIPKDVDFIAPTAFIETLIESISIDRRNCRFAVNLPFLVDVIKLEVIRYLPGNGPSRVWREIKSLGSFCFHRQILNRLDFAADSQLSRIEEFCFCESSVESIKIPRSVEVLGKSCFTTSNIQALTFEAGSRLEQIEENCFAGCSLPSLLLPNSVEVLGKSCFSDAKLETLTFEANSQAREIGESCFHRSSLKSICIPRHIIALPQLCFAGCQQLESVTFESESALKRISESCFQDCSLRSLRLPKNVSEIGESAFNEQLISVDPANLRFMVRGTFLIDVLHFTAVSLSASSDRINVWKHIKALGKSCFRRRTIESIFFETNCELMRIEESCFACCEAKSICIVGGPRGGGGPCDADHPQGNRDGREGDTCLESAGAGWKDRWWQVRHRRIG